MALTAKQRKFIEVYAGNGTEAARLAGYKGSDATLAVVANENLRKPKVAEAIKARQDEEGRNHIATRQERQAFWSSTMLSGKVDWNARLKASELLGKSEADFTEKVEHSGALTLEQLVVESLKPPGEGA